MKMNSEDVNDLDEVRLCNATRQLAKELQRYVSKFSCLEAIVKGWNSDSLTLKKGQGYCRFD